VTAKPVTAKHASLWLDRPRPAANPPIPDGSRVDVVVIGAGLTGLCTALELSRSGATVAVLDARRAGSVTTGRTTGKISLLQGTKLSQIAARYPRDVVRAYVDANRNGRRRLLDLCRSFGVPVQIETAYTYATTPGGTAALADEFEAASGAGLDVGWNDFSDLPFPVTGAIALAEQAQFDPVDLVEALVHALRERGVPVVENTRVRIVSRGLGRTAVHHAGGSLTADRVVLATGTPILDRGSFFARLEPRRSYCLAVAGVDRPPRGMYLSADSPTRSLRYVPTADGELLVVGGNGHTVGRGGATKPRVADLIDWTGRHFPGGDVTHMWSAQDYHSTDEMPLVGGVLPGDDRILVASGYDKWDDERRCGRRHDRRTNPRGAPGVGEALRPVGPEPRSEKRRAHPRTQRCSSGRDGQGVDSAARPISLVDTPRRHWPRARRGSGPRSGLHRRRPDPPSVRGVPSSRGHCPLERRRTQLGLPAARFPVHPGGTPPRGPRDPGSERIGLRCGPSG